MIVKDPNKPILRLYDIPDTTFESEEESGESEEGEWLCLPRLGGSSGIFGSVLVIYCKSVVFNWEESQDNKSIID